MEKYVFHRNTNAHTTKCELTNGILWNYKIQYERENNKYSTDATYQCEKIIEKVCICQEVNINNIQGTETIQKQKAKTGLKNWIDISWNRTNGQQMYEKYLISLINREMKIKTTMKYNLTPVRMTII